MSFFTTHYHARHVRRKAYLYIHMTLVQVSFFAYASGWSMADRPDSMPLSLLVATQDQTKHCLLQPERRRNRWAYRHLEFCHQYDRCQPWRRWNICPHLSQWYLLCNWLLAMAFTCMVLSPCVEEWKSLSFSTRFSSSVWALLGRWLGAAGWVAVFMECQIRVLWQNGSLNSGRHEVR